LIFSIKEGPPSRKGKGFPIWEKKTFGRTPPPRRKQVNGRKPGGSDSLGPSGGSDHTIFGRVAHEGKGRVHPNMREV